MAISYPHGIQTVYGDQIERETAKGIVDLAQYGCARNAMKILSRLELTMGAKLYADTRDKVMTLFVEQERESV